ncbi:MAG: hypothetical protein WC584_00210 [Candidatus Pacearchaeota archaeon]
MNKKSLLKEVDGIYGKYRKIIWKEIPKKTKVTWKIKEIKFESWDRGYWAAENNKIFVGYDYKPKSKILTSIIHEAIHLNTINKKNQKRFSNSEKNAITREIATCILTNFIIQKINKKLKKKFKKNRFDEWYKKYEGKSKEFEKLSEDKNFYEFFSIIKERI